MIQGIFVLPGTEGTEGFFALPYPNDLRIDAQGFVNLDELEPPNAFMADYFEAIDSRQKGFGTTSAIFVRFSGAIDGSTLPIDVNASLQTDSSVYLLNVDSRSMAYGSRVPIECYFQKRGGEIIGENWLSCLPFPGIVLDESTTYALVVSVRLRALDGAPLQSSPVLADVLSGNESSDLSIRRARLAYEPLTIWLDLPGDDEREDVVSAAVFTTQAATDLMGRFRKVIYEKVEAPVAREVSLRTERAEYSVYTGRFNSPNFQAGEYPYQNLAQGGGFVLDAAGDPVVQSSNDLRFSMSIPSGLPMPTGGWPVVIYAHGTGGDYLSYETNGTALRMALEGIAVISIDQLMHGDRLDSGDVQILFFNVQNPLSSRANVMQAGLEDFQLLRLVKGFSSSAFPSIHFDNTKTFFFGHSQGSSTGLPFVAREPNIKAAVFSGAGGLLYLSLLQKKKPFDISELIRVILRDRDLNRFHPALALVQAFYEPADSVAYGHLLVSRPPDEFEPKNIFQPIGLGDNYTPTPTLEALATAVGLDLAGPALQELPGLQLTNKKILNLPITNNSETLTTVTAVAAQFRPVGGLDGHFVSFDLAPARKQISKFFGTLSRTGRATLVLP